MQIAARSRPIFEGDDTGRATLASAHTLWDEGILHPETPARFHTKGGLLTTVLQQDGIGMDFPAGERVYLQGKSVAVLAGQLRV